METIDKLIYINNRIIEKHNKISSQTGGSWIENINNMTSSVKSMNNKVSNIKKYLNSINKIFNKITGVKDIDLDKLEQLKKQVDEINIILENRKNNPL